MVDLRGNVPTRVRKLAESEWDGIVLARAGLERLAFRQPEPKSAAKLGNFFLEILPAKFFYRRVVRESLLFKFVLTIKAQKRFSRP